MSGVKGSYGGLQELFTPIVQALVAIGCLLGISVARFLHPLFEQLHVLLQHQKLAQNGVGLQGK